MVFSKECRVKCACCGRKLGKLMFFLEYNFETYRRCVRCGVVNFVYCYSVVERENGTVIVGLYKIYTLMSGGYEWKIVLSTITDTLIEAKTEGS
jgi:hypothetical protein